ncbi:hypothetical protein [Neorhizobium galegae]|uniref:hypothetical protein n=1 Tax=Neorhizobium galegae TaxID=399 RepID=UPI002DD44F0F|nr:hypothetical protein [Neorhizobium galegae]
MPELGTLDQGQAASLAGLAPVARQSGGMDRPCLHPRRTRQCPADPIHAGTRRHAL